MQRESSPVNAFTTTGEACYTRRSEEHTSELQSQSNLVCRLLLEKKKNISNRECGDDTRLSSNKFVGILIMEICRCDDVHEKELAALVLTKCLFVLANRLVVLRE